MLKAIQIYTLADPRDGSIRWVGQTGNNPKTRATMCIAANGNEPKRKWLADLRAAGLKPVQSILEFTTWHNATEREQYWMAEFKKRGEPLLNLRERHILMPETERRWVDLTPDQIAELKRQGDGNLSEGIRRLLAEKGETR